MTVRKGRLARKDAVKPLSDRERGHASTTTRMIVARAVWDLWDEVVKEEAVDRQWLADRLGKDKTRISRLLNGPGNWTLDTVAELLEAMGGRITTVKAARYHVLAAVHDVEPSLQGLRDYPEFWRVIEVKSTGDDDRHGFLEYDAEVGAIVPTMLSSVSESENF